MKTKTTRGRTITPRRPSYYCPDPSCEWTGGDHAGPGLYQHVKKWHPTLFPAWSRNPRKMEEAQRPSQQRIGQTGATQSASPSEWIESIPQIRQETLVPPTQPKTRLQLAQELYTATLRDRDNIRIQIADTRNLERRERELTEELASIASTLATMGAPVSSVDTPSANAQPAVTTPSTSAEIPAVSEFEPELQNV